MSVGLSKYLAALTAALLGVSAASAQCLLCETNVTAAAALPAPNTLSVQIDSAIDFSRVALVTANQGGTATVDATTGTRTLTGSLVDLSGMPVQGTVTIRGVPNQSLAVVMPSSVTLSTTGGGTIQLASITTTLKPNPRTDRNGLLQFSFGGRVTIDGRSFGTFRGSIPITVDYR